MKQLSLVIIDDERSARELIRDLLKGIEWVEILGEAGNVDEAMELVERTGPDLLLLDIQMPGEDGFALIEQLVAHEWSVGVIFVTAYEQYAIRALRASAFDYLLKPVKRSDLVASLEKYADKVSSEQLKDKFAQLIYQLGGKKKIKFRNRTGFMMIDPDDIIYCQADSNYTVLVLESERSMTVSMNLGRIEELLPEICFARISRSVIINLHYLVQVDRRSMTCELMHHAPVRLKVSRNYLKQLEFGCERHFEVKNTTS